MEKIERREKIAKAKNKWNLEKNIHLENVLLRIQNKSIFDRMPLMVKEGKKKNGPKAQYQRDDDDEKKLKYIINNNVAHDVR